MLTEEIRKLLRELKSGKIDENEAIEYLRSLPFSDLGFAKIDHQRTLRRGFPEVIFGKGKTKEQIVDITKEMSKFNNVLITKTNEKVFDEIIKFNKNAVYNSDAQIISIKKNTNTKLKKKGRILVLTGGTADFKIAEEAIVTAKFFGNTVESIFDVGVAGIHRLFAYLPQIKKSGVIIVVAGMDGALASVVSGLVDKPVIAVPTSVGYGASFEGIAPLLSMLNSCSPGVAVVNIDNGFGAGYLASLINK